ncbi:MAG: hypothetical protein EOP48_21780 [Sphingobacteriales bacterium]|nr:MAG: hypothetical protein EOP48_21780 [Sphingobacteriales bacterium]
MEDKLFAHQAIQDSIVVKDSEVNNMMAERIDALVERAGSMDKLLKYYNKPNEEEFKTYFFDILKMVFLLWCSGISTCPDTWEKTI